MRARIIDTESQWLNSLEDTEGVIRERFLSGLDGSNSLADLEAARANAALTRASLAARQQSQANAWRQLAALQGKTGTEDLIAALPLSATVPSISNPLPGYPLKYWQTGQTCRQPCSVLTLLMLRPALLTSNCYPALTSPPA